MSAKKLFPMLSAENVAASLSFYGDLLGGVEEFRFPEDDPVFYTLKLGESEIGIGGVSDAPMHGRPQRPATGHRIELCVYVEDVDRLVAAAKSRDVPVRSEPADMPWGERVAFIEDPDGNPVMLITELDG